MKKYYSMTKANEAATITIYGDITSCPWCEGDTSSSNLSAQLDALGDVSEIDVYINSYGGECAEGLAIYNALKRHKAKVRTYCDGFACSIASVIFMAGDERIMNESSLLMIHNAWSFTEGNAKELRKAADDLDKVTQASVIAYKANSSLTEDEIKELLDAESWLLPEEALEYGFATAISKTPVAHASQSAKMQLLDIVKKYRSALVEDEEEQTDDADTEEDSEADTPEDESEDETTDEEEPEQEEAEEVEEDSDEQETPAQKWSGFFNALLKI